MPLPIVAIVGRPNVGKSSLFNMLAERRISIVEPTAGVTRDRIATTLSVGERHFDLVDTGGMGIVDVDNLTDDVERQITHALDSADVILFVVDIRDGVVPLDQHVAERLRGIAKPVVFIGNKADDTRIDQGAGELYRLGYGEPLLASANNKRGRDEILAAIERKLPQDDGSAAPDDPILKLAIVGRRNVGKSTFINSLAGEDRVIVSEVPGTTRDSIDVRFVRDAKTYLVIDTAGVRKKSSLANDIEYYALHRAERSIRRADVTLHFFDARLKIGRVDKQLAEYIIAEHKPAIFVVNKWDLVKHAMATEKMATYLRKMFPMLDYVPIAFITAKQGKNTIRLLNLAAQLHKQAGRRISTGELNRILKQSIAEFAPPVRYNRQGRIYYAAQVGTHPPTIAMVTNGPDLFDQTYTRYLTKTLRDNGPFGEVPLKLAYRERGEGGGGAGKGMPEKLEAEATEVMPEPVEPPTAPAEPAAVPKKKKKDKAPETWDL
jgi:GTPase